MKGGKLAGLIIFILIAGVAVGYYFWQQNQMPEVHLKGYIGGEKKGFLEDEEVQALLKKKYGIVLDVTKAGSIEMAQDASFHTGDFIWPSSQVALELFKMKFPGKQKKSKIVFNSPIVVYSWDVVTKALIKIGVVKKVNDTYYIVDFPKLIQLVIEEKKWGDIGLDLYGNVIIISTDPTKSNSGNMFSGLLANILLGDVVTEESITNVLPTVTDFFSRLGFLQHSSGTLFSGYLNKGVGEYPLVVGYENQIVEFALMNPNLWPRAKNKVRILYPEPTVWSSHPLITLNDKANVLLTALEDEEIMKLAWEKHGFRTGPENDPKVLDVAGIPAEITKVMRMPRPEVMDAIIKALGGNE